MRYSARLVQISLVASVMSACGFVGLKEKPGTTYGEILVSGPSVDTRERLLTDRKDQYLWLQQQLKDADDADFGVNGERTRKSATTFTLNTVAKVDPTGTALYAADSAKQLAALKNAAKLDDLDYQIEVQKRKLILKNGETETDPAKISAPAGAATAATAVASPAPAIPEQAAPKSTADANKSVVEAMTAALAPSANGKMVPSPTELFRDRLAYREEIRNEMISYGLDDRHDIRGNALYRISLDATVLPGNDTGAWAVISVCVQRPGADRCLGNGTTESTGAGVPTNGGTGTQTKSATTFTAVDGAALKRALVSDFTVQKDRLFNDLTLRIYDPKKIVDLNSLNKRSKGLILAGTRAVLEAKKASPPIHVEIPAEDAKIKDGRPKLEKVIRVMQLMADGSKPIGPVSLETLSGPLEDVCAYLEGAKFSFDTGHAYVKTDLLANACIKGEKDGALLLLQYLGTVGLVLDTKEALYRQSDGTKSMLEYFNDALKTPIPACAKCRTLTCAEHAGELSALAFVDNALTFNLNFEKLVTSGLGRGSLEIYAYGATPKESVQRIADVVTRREGVQLAVGLQALAGNVGVSALTDFMNINEGIFNALKRQPLVIGFGHSSANTEGADAGDIGRSDFGWIIGPRYGTSLNGKSANFRHTVVQNGLSAIVSIPGWWDKAELVINRYWVSEAGKFQKDEPPGTQVSAKLSQIKYTIAVPGSAEDALNILSGDTLMRVQEERLDEAAWKVKIGAPAEIMIRGKNLWRNPQVRLGSQFASSVRLMPDMDGVVALFANVVESYGAPLSIAGRSAPKNSVPVTIATPAGLELVGYAELMKDPTPVKKLAVDGGAVVIGGVPNVLNLNLPLPGYWKIEARYRKAGTSTEFIRATAAQVARPKNNQLTFQIPSLPTLKTGDAVELQLLLTYAKGDEPETLSVDGALVYYPTAKDWKVEVAAITSTPVDSKDKAATYTVSLKFPDGYEKALGITNSKARFTVSQHDELGTLECTLKKNTCDLVMSLPAGLGAVGLALNPEGLKDDVPNPLVSPLKVSVTPAPAKPAARKSPAVVKKDPGVKKEAASPLPGAKAK